MTTFTRVYPLHRGISILAIISIAVLIATGCSNDSNKPLSSENSKFNNGSASSEAGETGNTAPSRPESLTEPLEIPTGDAATLIEFIKNVTSPSADHS